MDLTELTKVAPHVYRDVRGNVYADLTGLVKQLRRYRPGWQREWLLAAVDEQLRAQFPHGRITYV